MVDSKTISSISITFPAKNKRTCNELYLFKFKIL